jgi:hypothetical protein
MVIITGQVPTPRDRPGRLPGVRHGRHHPAHASSTTSWSRTCATSPRP